MKKWFRQLFCKHDWEYSYYASGIGRYCRYCKKVEVVHGSKEFKEFFTKQCER